MKQRDEIRYVDEVEPNGTDHETRKVENTRACEIELTSRPRKASESLLETDNVNNAKPNSGPEIDDLESSGGSRPPENLDKGIDDGLLDPDGGSRRSSTPAFPGPGIFPPISTENPPIYPDITSIPDINVYQQKKIIAQGMMDLALISANASQFRYVLQTNGNHPYYYASLSMIAFSLFFQFVVALGLIWNCRFNVNVNAQMCKANYTNNWVVVGVFFVTVLNVFISSFSVVEFSETISACLVENAKPDL